MISSSSLRATPTREAVELGLLIGVVEAVSIVRWDWLMADHSLWRVSVGLLWGLAILAMTAGLWVVLHRLCRRQRLVAATLFLGLVTLTRWWVNDRFQAVSLVLIPVALLVAWKAPKRLLGLLAVLVAMPALWGRVPNYVAPPLEQVGYLLPGALAAVVIAALPWKRSILVGAPTAVVALILAGSIGRGAPPPGQGPNLLFILVDTLRRDHIAPYEPSASSPSFARLAREGVLFEDAVTVIPKTTQSVAAFFTGRYPVTNRVRKLRSRLPNEEVTLAEVLRDHGYDTAAFVHNGWVMRGRGFEQGFAQFWSFFELEAPYGPLGYTGFVTLLDGLFLRRARKFDGNTNAGVVTDRAIQWLGLERDRPFFAYVHYFDPHWPYRPPGEDGECLVNNIKDSNITRGEMIFQNKLAKEENARARELYRGEVAYNTDQIGRLLDWIDESGGASNTIVVFTADHGHHLGDHDYYFHHGELLYEQGIRIPLAIRWPDRLQAGRVVQHQVRSIDLMPTLLSMLAIEGPTMDGAPALDGPVAPAFLETDISYFKANKRRFVKGNAGKVRGIRTDRWKLIHTPRKTGGGLWELYDLAADRDELNDLVAAGKADPAVLKPLIEELNRWIPASEKRALAKMGDHFDDLPVAAQTEETGNDEQDLSSTDRDMLRSLGYIQ